MTAVRKCMKQLLIDNENLCCFFSLKMTRDSKTTGLISRECFVLSIIKPFINQICFGVFILDFGPLAAYLFLVTLQARRWLSGSDAFKIEMTNRFGGESVKWAIECMMFWSNFHQSDLFILKLTHWHNLLWVICHILCRTYSSSYLIQCWWVRIRLSGKTRWIFKNIIWLIRGSSTALRGTKWDKVHEEFTVCKD